MKRQKKKKTTLPVWVLVAGGGLILAAVVLFLVRPTGQTAQQPPAAANNNIPYPEIERVTLADSKTALEAGDAVIVDVRSAEAYAASHIAGAVSIPLEELQARLSSLDPADWIITYCT